MHRLNLTIFTFWREWENTSFPLHHHAKCIFKIKLYVWYMISRHCIVRLIRQKQRQVTLQDNETPISDTKISKILSLPTTYFYSRPSACYPFLHPIPGLERQGTQPRRPYSATNCWLPRLAIYKLTADAVCELITITCYVCHSTLHICVIYACYDTQTKKACGGYFWVAEITDGQVVLQMNYGYQHCHHSKVSNKSTSRRFLHK